MTAAKRYVSLLVAGALSFSAAPLALAQDGTKRCENYHFLHQSMCRLNILRESLDASAGEKCDPYGEHANRRRCLSRERVQRFTHFKGRSPNYQRYRARRRQRHFGDNTKDFCNELLDRRERWMCARQYMQEYRQQNPRAYPLLWQ